MKQKIITLFLILIGLTCQSQDLIKPQKINFKNNFKHKHSKTEFPKNFLDGFELVEVYAFDKKKKNIGVTYEKKTEPKGRFTVYIYPAEDGTEYRLRKEYLSSRLSINGLIENDIIQYPVKYKGKKYDCNGYKSEFKSQNKENSSLIVYECGTWFFKLQLTTEEKDSIQIEKIENSILEKFDPSRLTEQKPLNKIADIRFGKKVFRDSILIGSAMGSAYSKLEWVMDNLTERERASGFPGHYLELQISALNEFVAFDKEYNYKKSEFTQKYLNQLNSLIEAGYLDEFIMEEFSMVMIVPDNHEFDFDGFKKWKETNKITINLNEYFYVISFGQK
jgi:hypothetical protein